MVERETNGWRQAEFPLRVAVCAWCKRKKDNALEEWSHGICPRHLRLMRAKVAAMKL